MKLDLQAVLNRIIIEAVEAQARIPGPYSQSGMSGTYVDPIGVFEDTGPYKDTDVAVTVRHLANCSPLVVVALCEVTWAASEVLAAEDFKDANGGDVLGTEQTLRAKLNELVSALSIAETEQ